MRAAKLLVVVRRGESVLGRELPAEFYEGRILIEAAWKRAGVIREDFRDRRIRSQKGTLCGCVAQSLQRRTIVDGDRLIPQLPFVVRQVKELVLFQRPTHGSAELLPPIRGFRDAQLIVDRVIRIQLRV